MSVHRLPAAIVTLPMLVLFAAASTLADRSQAWAIARSDEQASGARLLDGLTSHPWPQPYHDAQRTGRSSIVGPQSPTVKYVYAPPGGSGFFYYIDIDITVAQSGRGYSQIEHCIPYSQGCIGFYDTIYLLRPNGTARIFPIDTRIQYSTPVIGPDGTVYASSSNGLAALSPLGLVKWTYAGAGTPTLGADGTLYAFTGLSLIALDPAGNLKWSVPLPDNPFTPMAIGPGGEFYYGSTDRYLTALTPTGVLKWRFFTSDQMHSPPSIGDDGSIYAGGNRLYALSPDGNLQWTYTAFGQSLSGTTPAIGADGSLYLPTIYDGVVALNPDGTQKWTYPRSEVGRRITVGGDGTLYTSWSASIYDTGILALTDTGELKWTFPLSYPDDVGFGVAPTLGPDGTLYFATNYKIFALGTAP